MQYIEYWDCLSEWVKDINISVRDLEVRFYLIGGLEKNI